MLIYFLGFWNLEIVLYVLNLGSRTEGKDFDFFYLGSTCALPNVRRDSKGKMINFNNCF